MLKDLFLLSEYTVYVKTSSDATLSGTDANVWIKIHGKKGSTGVIKLGKSENYKDPFEHGQ